MSLSNLQKQRHLKMPWLVATLVALLAGVGGCSDWDVRKPTDEGPGAPNDSETSSPKAVYLAYLKAVHDGDLEKAKQCWWAPPEQRCFLDVLVGVWVVQHEFNKELLARYGKSALSLVRDDCTDEALDRTVQRVKSDRSIITAKQDEATMQIDWARGDGAAFSYSGKDPVHFRRSDGRWWIDAVKMADLDHTNGRTFTEPGSIAWMMKITMRAQQIVMESLSALNDIAAVEKQLQAQGQALIKNAPLRATLSPDGKTFPSSARGELICSIRNASTKPVQIDTFTLRAGVLSLDVLNPAGKRVPTIPPGMPPPPGHEKDYLVTLKPGQEWKTTYSLHLFSPELPPGAYRVRMRYVDSNEVKFLVRP